MKRLWLGVVAIAVAVPVQAQEPILSAKLAELQPATYQVPFCSLKPDKQVKKGVDAFRKTFDEKADPAEKAAKLAEAKALILEGIAESQAGNAASWYFLARVYLRQGDIGGVDSAFKKAEALEPSCEIDINQYRQNNWAALANAGLELQRAGDIEAAIGLFRDATRLFSQLPHVASNLGVLFANSGQDDSAAAYFSKALTIAESAAESDTTLIADRNANALNLALMYQRLERHQEAIPVLEKYLGWDPGSVDARKALSQSFRGAGMEDKAKAIEDKMIAEMSRQNLDSLDTQDIMNIGVAAFNSRRYDQAAQAFDKAASRNPFSRDAIYNLANTYLAVGNDHKKVADSLAAADSAKAAPHAKAARDAFTKLIEVSKQLVDLEPMNEDVFRLLGQGHRGVGNDDDVLKAAEKLVGLQVSIDVLGFQMGRNTARLNASATGRKPTDAMGKDIKPAPFVLVFEFLDVTGQVIDSKDVDIPVVEAGKAHEIAVEGSGANIAAWRYRKK